MLEITKCKDMQVTTTGVAVPIKLAQRTMIPLETPKAGIAAQSHDLENLL